MPRLGLRTTCGWGMLQHIGPSRLTIVKEVRCSDVVLFCSWRSSRSQRATAMRSRPPPEVTRAAAPALDILQVARDARNTDVVFARIREAVPGFVLRGIP